MNTTTTPPLRASCDRCRAQKLRCLPSSKGDASSSCERCLKAKPPKPCVFSRRSRTGRYPKSAGDPEARLANARKEQDAMKTTALPGMSTFSLSIPSPPPCPVVETQRSLGSPWTDLWEQDSIVLSSLDLDPSLQHSSSMLFGSSDQSDEHNTSDGDDTAGSRKIDYTFDITDHLDVQNFLPSPPDIAPANMDIDMDMETGDKLIPLVNLTSLLTKMSHYEKQLTRLSGTDELDNYPMGDALFLSQHFYSILSDYGHPPALTAISPTEDMPTMLLTLSCYMTLTRIYSSVFGYLHSHFSHQADSHSSHNGAINLHSPNNFALDTHAYRGLRLCELRPVCLCSSWGPAKKAVSMLLASLGGTEGLLGLPPDLRAIAAPSPLRGLEGKGEGGMLEGQGKGEGGRSSAATSPTMVGERTTALFEEVLMVALTNGRLYKTMSEQARDLRRKVEEVEGLLVRLVER